MADFRPTASQQAAIDTRGGAVLVSAGAGSGKTRVLTERLMGYICDDAHPVDLDSFLIITFTRAAAAELRGRIMEELAARLAADPGSRRLRRQSALCRRAQIGTIHSFCANVLRENCHALGLTPDFRIADEERAEAMRAAALERTLDARYDAMDQLPGFRLLADTVGAGRDDRRLSDLVLKLHSAMPVRRTGRAVRSRISRPRRRTSPKRRGGRSCSHGQSAPPIIGAARWTGFLKP